MNTTETGPAQTLALTSFPTLRLLFAGGVGVSAAPGRVLKVGATKLGRDVGEREGIGLPADGRASRLHAVVRTGSDGREVVLTDEGSKNGSFVNGQRTAECALRDGDVLRIGNSFFLLRYEAALQPDAGVPGLLGSAPAVRSLRKALSRVAPTDATVLLLGESGTGKEVAAQGVHRLSGRSGPFLAINCAAIPEHLAESELFGHAAGAFTGARAAQPGYFRAAQGGTLFLDELGELSLPLQAKLLRALEQRQVTPVGSTQAVSVDVRLLAATNRDLEEAVRAGRFRGDLYARLAEIVVSLPALRHRREDVLPLLVHLLGDPRAQLTPELVDALLLYPWPFNVRELTKVATQLRICSDGTGVLELSLVADRLQPERAVSRPATGGSVEAPAEPATEDADPRRPPPTRDELARLLREHGGVVSKVARAVGRSRRQVDRWIEQHGLDVRERED